MSDTTTNTAQKAGSHARENFAIPTILGNAYPPELPNDVALNMPATEDKLGLIKVGNNLSIRPDGTLDAASGPGGGIATIKAGEGIAVDATDPNNPEVKATAASDTELGAIKVGNNLSIRPDGTLDAASGPGGGITTIKAGEGIAVDATDPNNPIVSALPVALPVAGELTLGAIKVGDNLTITEDGTLSGTPTGGAVAEVVSGAGIKVDSTEPTKPIVSASVATTSTVGAVKVGSGLNVTDDGTISVVPSNNVIKILEGSNYSYTIQEEDVNLDIVFNATTSNPLIFVDGNLNYKQGSIIRITVNGANPAQFVGINECILNTGGAGGGRAAGTSLSYSSNNKADYANGFSQQQAQLLCISPTKWILKGNIMQMGNPYVESVTVVPVVYTPGQVLITTAPYGEDFARLYNVNYIATPIDSIKKPPVVTGNRKGNDFNKIQPPFLLKNLQEDYTYDFTVTYTAVKLPGDPPPYLTFNSINTIRFTVPGSIPKKPLNIEVKGMRGSKTLFTMDPQGYAPVWATIQAEVITENNKCITQNGDSTFVSCGFNSIDNSPYFKDCYSFDVDQFPSILPSGDKASNYNNCKVRIRLVTPGGLVGVESDQFIVNFKDGFVPPTLNIRSIDKFTKVVLFDWIAPEPNYDTDKCHFLFQIYQGESLKSTQTLRWSDTDAAFSGDPNTDYYASLTDDTYGVVGSPGPKIGFRIPSPF